jgi:hypothetical protein
VTGSRLGKTPYFASTVLGGLEEVTEAEFGVTRRSERLIVLLHAFRKTTAKLPTSEVDTARTRWQDFQARMNTKPRRPPRAAGRDAP